MLGIVVASLPSLEFCYFTTTLSYCIYERENVHFTQNRKDTQPFGNWLVEGTQLYGIKSTLTSVLERSKRWRFSCFARSKLYITLFCYRQDRRTSFDFECTQCVVLYVFFKQLCLPSNLSALVSFSAMSPSRPPKKQGAMESVEKYWTVHILGQVVTLWVDYSHTNSKEMR